MPNPRGSYGQGEAFTQANRKDFGYGDLRDILAGVDTVLAKYPVDPNRVGITGWSYGGFMTMFAVTQTHRFRAAVAGAGISDWLSYYGENSIDQWMIPYFGASVYDDPQVYAKSSAITFIKNVTTPTLAVVGDRDGECPAPQSFEFWHALRDLHVPAQLVVYPNEGHGFSDPAHRQRCPATRHGLVCAVHASHPLTRRGGSYLPSLPHSLQSLAPLLPVFLLPIRLRHSLFSRARVAGWFCARGRPVLIHFFLGVFSVRLASSAACGSVPPGISSLGAIHLLRADPKHEKGRQ